MSTGKSHPLATTSPTLLLRRLHPVVPIEFTLRISGNLVALLVRLVDEFAIWDWKTGTLLFVSNFNDRHFPISNCEPAEHL